MTSSLAMTTAVIPPPRGHCKWQLSEALKCWNAQVSRATSGCIFLEQVGMKGEKATWTQLTSWRSRVWLDRRVIAFIVTWVRYLKDLTRFDATNENLSILSVHGLHLVHHVSPMQPSGYLTYIFHSYVKWPEGRSWIVQRGKAMGPTHHQPGPARLPHKLDSAFSSASGWWTKGPFGNKDTQKMNGGVEPQTLFDVVWKFRIVSEQ